MPRCISDLREMLASLIAKARPTPSCDDHGLVLDLEGWRLYTKTGLSGDGPTFDGDLVLLCPDNTVLNANWDARADRTACVEFLTEPHLQLQFYLPRGIRTWDELAAAIKPLLSTVAGHYALPEPSNPSL